MDPLTHVLVTCTFVGRRPTTLFASVTADAPFYLTYPWWLLTRGEQRRPFAHNTWPSPPRWMLTAHHAMHSLPMLFGVATCTRLITGRWPSAPVRAWLLHILIDIPTDGISWAELAIMALQRAREDRTALP